MPVPEYIRPLKKQFELHRNEENAKWAKAYMKGQYEYYGIKSPTRKELTKEHRRLYGLLPGELKVEIVKWCWAQPQREYNYFVMEMLQKSVKKEAENIINLYEFMIIENSWWDTIDFIASNLVGPYFKLYPDNQPKLTVRWMDSGNMWLQRTCLLFQLKYKADLNTELLEQFIEPLASSKEFFIRKAIGWILREYSKTNADYVRSFVENNDLSGLSRREALKWLNNH